MRKAIYIGILLLLGMSVWAEKQYTVVLDAGHGGKDPGAVGRFSNEKDLNLALVLKMGELINAQYPDVKVIYTRSTDVFIPLQERANIANKANADLFISIHTNSSDSKAPRGVETFILGTERMEANLDVAMRENAVIKLESDYKTTYAGFDPNSIDSYIMFELMQNSYMEQSLLFAEQVQQRFVGHLNREDRGVRQAAFWVLLKTACPSILFEMGFISNPEEERFLNQPASIAQMANALVNAFGAYTHRVAVRSEGVKDAALQDAAKAATGREDAALQDAAKAATGKEDAALQDAAKAATGKEDAALQDAAKAATGKEPQTYYGLQVCASRAPLAANDPKLQGVSCECRQVGDWYKYYAIIDTDRDKVAEKQKEIRTLFPDCWITKWSE